MAEPEILDEVEFQLGGGGGGGEESHFEIDNPSGQLLILSSPDREAAAKYPLKIR